MSRIYWEEKILRGFPPGTSSRFPAMRDPIKTTIQANLGEYDGLFLRYGMFSDSLPYTMQDNYDAATEKQDLHFQSVILENDFLKATFLPELGGRLWSLFDKTEKRDLILDNPEFLPGNLAIRNAWFAGGVEWNLGRRGHDEQTCSSRFVAELEAEDKTPVLRIYEYNRDRMTPFQLDFFLPDTSRFLFQRVRIWNPNETVVPMYYWSNIAVEEVPGCRVVVPATEAYSNCYENGSHSLKKLPLPDGEGFDATYPGNFEYVKDHFYNIPENSRKYECVFCPDGSGFVHASTKRLQGRKLFVWGYSQGGCHWQRKLGPKNYIEIQAGLAKTQMECLPMPPETAWEWLEAYGAIQMNPDSIFGSWDGARNAAQQWLEKQLPESHLDEILHRTESTFAKKAGVIRHHGSGWGALAERQRGRKFCDHLDFGMTGPEQADALQLLEEKKLNDMPPSGFVLGTEWRTLLENVSIKNWKSYYFLSLEYFRAADLSRALETVNQSISLNCNAYNLHAHGNILRRCGDRTGTIRDISACVRQCRDDASLVKEALKILAEQKAWEEILQLHAELPKDLESRPMVCLLYATALAHTDRIEEAWNILHKNGGLEIPDLREGEASVSELYTDLFRRRQKLPENMPVEIPYIFDIRMTKNS